ncbi:MAG: flagellar filament capping protein FliD [Phycisphaeraceae bacterium]|nr:flagellar filament capping protein FliD [Phycisphaeraceae bacterium]
MSGISSSVGLISGINHQQLIEQLIQIEARPQTLVKNQNTILQSQQTAFQAINAKLLALQSIATRLSNLNSFRATTASSSNEDVLTLTSGTATTPGTYRFAVNRLVSSQQMLTAGFVDADQTPLGAGVMSFEGTAAKLSTETRLSDLSLVGGGDFARGKIKITNRAGASATIDLTRAVTVNDILDAINAQEETLGVTARVNGDKLELVDSTGGSGNLIVADVSSTFRTATSLGLAGSVASDTLTGQRINGLTDRTQLTALNDGNGVRLSPTVGEKELHFSLRDGTTFDVELSAAKNIGDVVSAINTAGAGSVTAAIGSDGVSLSLVDNSTPDGSSTFSVQDLGNGKAATDLGIALSDGDNDGQIDGSRVLAAINSRLLKNIRGASGAGMAGFGSIDITNRLGATTTVDLSAATSLSDVLDAINASGAGVEAGLNNVGNGIKLTDMTGGSGDLVVADVAAGEAASRLNIAGSFALGQDADSGNLQMQYITEATRLSTLNGGKGVASGKILITDAAGATKTVTLTISSTTTLADVIRQINSSTGGTVTARINDKGDGLMLEDAISGANAIKVEESGSTTAKDLNILGTAAAAGDAIDGSFEKSITISAVTALTGATLLGSLNKGEGVGNSIGKDDVKFTLRDGSTFNLNVDGLTTVQEVIDAIGTASVGKLTASINPAGLGLTLVDSSTPNGSSVLKVEALNSATTAKDLGLLGSAAAGSDTLNGSTIVGVTTLTDLMNRINELGAGVRATIINDGSSSNPFRLSLNAANSGAAGAFLFDDGGLGLSAIELEKAQDAVVFVGDPARGGVAVTSSTNSVKGLVPGASIDLVAPSDEVVTITVSRDTVGIASTMSDFVDAANSLITTINQYDSYDSENEQRGLLLGDSTLSVIESTIFSLISNRNGDVSGRYTAAAQVGITVGKGSVIAFDEAKFTEALNTDPSAVENFFSLKTVKTDDTGKTVFRTDGRPVLLQSGFGTRMDDTLKRLLDSTLQGRIDSIGNQIDLNDKRIEDMQTLLDAKRQRLQLQFTAMETALAKLQSQSSSLAGLSSLFSSASTSSSSTG